MNCVICLFVTVLYIVLLKQSEGQYQTIWYDDMKDKVLWSTVYPNGVTFEYSDPIACFDDTCILTKTTATNSQSGVYRSTDITSYSSIRLQFYLCAYMLEPEDTCDVYYAYDSVDNKQLIKSYQFPGSDPYDPYVYHYVHNATIDFPLSTSSTQLWIFFEVQHKDDIGFYADHCYWDEAYLKGTPRTPSPTDVATFTGFPTQIPTNTEVQSSTAELHTTTATVTETEVPTDFPTQKTSNTGGIYMVTPSPTDVAIFTGFPTQIPTNTEAELQTSTTTLYTSNTTTATLTSNSYAPQKLLEAIISDTNTISTMRTYSSNIIDQTSRSTNIGFETLAMILAIICTIIIAICIVIIVKKHKNKNEVKSNNVVMMSNKIHLDIVNVPDIPSISDKLSVILVESVSNGIANKQQTTDANVTEGGHPLIKADEFVIEGNDVTVDSGEDAYMNNMNDDETFEGDDEQHVNVKRTCDNTKQ